MIERLVGPTVPLNIVQVLFIDTVKYMHKECTMLCSIRVPALLSPTNVQCEHC